MISGEGQATAGSARVTRDLDDPGAKVFIRSAGALTGLESILGGGVMLGTLSLIEESTTSGKSVLCQHLARSLAKQMGSIGIDVSECLRDDRLAIFPVQEPVRGEGSGAVPWFPPATARSALSGPGEPGYIPFKADVNSP